MGWVGAPTLSRTYPRWMVQVWARLGLLRCPGPILDGWFRCGLGWGSYVVQDLLRCPGPILDGVGWVGAPILDGWFRCGLGRGSYVVQDLS